MWNQTQRTYNEMLATDQWSTNGQVALPAVQKITFKVAPTVILWLGTMLIQPISLPCPSLLSVALASQWHGMSLRYPRMAACPFKKRFES